MSSTVKRFGLVLAVAVALARLSSFGQTPSKPISQNPGTAPSAPPKPPPTPEALIDQLKETVVFITGKFARQMTVRAQDGSESRQNLEQSIRGTGYLITVPMTIQGVSLEGTYLVTNKHMIREPGPDGVSGQGPYLSEIEVRVNTKSPIANSDKSYQTVIVPVMNLAGQMMCFVDNQDEDVDLALCPIKPDVSQWEFKTLGPDTIGTPQKLKAAGVNETSEILFAGLFVPFAGVKRNYPVVRHGKIAMLAGERVPILSSDRTADVYLGDVMSFGGNSGSPVFVRYGGAGDAGLNVNVGYYLLGTMQGFFNTQSPVAVQTAFLQGVASENTGVAFIVPAQKILEIMSLPGADYCQKVDAARYFEGAGQTKQAFDLLLEEDKKVLNEKNLAWCEYTSHTMLMRNAKINHIPDTNLPKKNVPDVLPNLPWRQNIKSSVKVDFFAPVAGIGLTATLFLTSETVTSYSFLVPGYLNPESEPIIVQKANVSKFSFIQ